MKYLIALDLDGTLLNSNSLLTDETINTIKELKKEHMIIIVTGRPYQSSINFYKELELDTPLINDNGGYISNPSNNGFKEIKFPLNGYDINKILKEAKPYIVSAFYTIKDDLYAYQYNEELAKAFLIETTSVKEMNEDVLGHLPTGMIFMIDSNNIEGFEEVVKKTNNDITYRLWGSKYGYSFYEIYNSDVSKWNGITEVLKLYPKIEKVIAFGDDINDIEMLTSAHIGVKMKNAKRLNDNIGTTTTKYTNDENGVAKFLKEYFKK